MKKIAFVVLVFSLSWPLISCGKKENPSVSLPASSGGGEGGEIIARIDGQSVTDEDVKKIAGPKLQQAQMELYDVRKEAVDQMVEDRILDAEAKKKGVTKEELLKKNVTDKIKVEDKEVEAFYNDKKSQMQGKSLDEMKANIKGYLHRDKYQKLYGNLIDSLRKGVKVEMLIKAPKVEVAEGDSPAIGPKDAPVKIIEFTDYQCPFCGRARATVNQVLSEYKGKVRYALRDFPLSFHKDSVKAHESAHCADDQGKYWEMNKKLFENQREIKVEDLKKYAEGIKLNTKKFNECLDSGKYAEKVQKDQQYGEEIGVSGTPAFFINGRMISGARPFESFKSIIEDELRNNK